MYPQHLFSFFQIILPPKATLPDVLPEAFPLLTPHNFQTDQFSHCHLNYTFSLSWCLIPAKLRNQLFFLFPLYPDKVPFLYIPNENCLPKLFCIFHTQALQPLSLHDPESEEYTLSVPEISVSHLHHIQEDNKNRSVSFPHLHTYTPASILTYMDSANILTYLPSPAQIHPGSSEDLRNPFSFLHKEKAKTVWR